jgi:hypothetical protein
MPWRILRMKKGVEYLANYVKAKPSLQRRENGTSNTTQKTLRGTFTSSTPGFGGK